MTANTAHAETNSFLDRWLVFAIWFYCYVYALEGFVRYVLNSVGLDSLIFARDVFLFLPVLLLFVQQFLKKNVHPAYWVYFAIIALHGSVFYLNFFIIPPVIFGIKILLPMLAGAVASAAFFKASKKAITLLLVLWLASSVGVFVDKYVATFPWVGMMTTIGEVEVEISRDWQVTGDSYRAGGLSRSSLYVSNFMPLIALLLIFNLNAFWLRALVALGTIPVIYWTTQKGALLAYLVVLAVLFAFPKKPLPAMRIAYFFFTLTAVLLPVALPYFNLSHDSVGDFSNNSFILRVEMMWPEAWDWIRRHEIFPFGVGLGGISSAQQIYAKNEINAADNIFVFMYAYFGLMALVYLALIFWASVRLPAQGSRENTLAMAILLFIMTYGTVLSMLEGQMAALFVGAALSWICYDRHRFATQPTTLTATPAPVSSLLLPSADQRRDKDA